MIRVALALVAGTIAVPALACVSNSPTVEAWAQCSFKVAHQTDDHRFLKSMAKAMVLQKNLKSTSMPRWQGIERRINQECGAFEEVARVDQKLFGKSHWIPETQFEAIYHAEQIEKLVRPNA